MYLLVYLGNSGIKEETNERKNVFFHKKIFVYEIVI